MHTPTKAKWTIFFSTLFSQFWVSAGANDLHPLGKPLPVGEISFELRDMDRSGKSVVIEILYQPYRESDVRKQRSLHLFDSPWRSGSRDLLSVHREDTHTISQTIPIIGSTVRFTLPLHAVEAGYEAYQLSKVRIGQLSFEGWFDGPPALGPEFGLQCTTEKLQGKARLSALTAAPLHGGLPLWLTLRNIQLDIVSIVQPDTTLWDPLTKQYWDGWRNSIPQEWPGGETVVTRHIDKTAVWRDHKYHAYAPGGTRLPLHPSPPAGVLQGASLEIFWPNGDKLEFPDAHFSQPATVLAMRLANLTSRAREIIARSVELRPGVEQYSITAEEWTELEEVAEDQPDLAVKFFTTESSSGEDMLAAQRVKLTEPWLYVFGIEYDEKRRVSTRAIVFDATAWNGPLPE